MVKDDSAYTYIFLFLSLLQTYTTIVMAIIGAVKIRKSGGLDMKSQVLLGLSITAQIAARLYLMLFVVGGGVPVGETSKVGLALGLPIPLHCTI